MTISALPAHEYDVCLSFAGEQRQYVQEVANTLREKGVRVFYDDYEKVNLWGKDLYEHLDYVYGRAARYCVLFASADYASKVWTTHERKSAQSRAFSENREYILPVRFDDTEIPGLRPTVGFVDASSLEPSELADLIREKLGPRVRANFFPPNPDRLFEALELETAEEKESVFAVAQSFVQSFRRMTVDERELVAFIFLNGCPSQMPENMHIELDIVRRDLGLPFQESIEKLRRLSTLGFEIDTREGMDHENELVVAVSWDDRSMASHGNSYAEEYSTLVADRILALGAGDLCDTCAKNCIEFLDFSNLSSATG
ncbi:toll/interleukin-1 receptor domain-containing protein [Streptomyces pseudogriseolus]|uniref:toll/interleukin-1 receptor domain-containing protein n=1 Tax=Streptomyces pseudogriseolus TaxID=36817 RepID=UPI003FA2B807